MRPLPFRRHPRWRAYDYTLPGSYFVTAVTWGREPILGTLTRGGVRLSTAGEIVQRSWAAIPGRFPGVTLDAFVVMPDHVHAIVTLSAQRDRTAGLSDVVGWTKRRAALEIGATRAPASMPVWQRSFHDRIIRNQEAFERIRRYIAENPAAAWDRRTRRSDHRRG